MKHSKFIFVFFAVLFTAAPSCTDKMYESFLANAPIYMSYTDLRLAVKMTQARDLNKPGKIYFKDKLIFINEQMKGVHIYDVKDPANPINMGFIEIPGNIDIAIKGNTLYADSYIDLVMIDISNLSAVKEVGRVQKIFSYTLPEYDKKYTVGRVDANQGVVTRWEVKNIRQELTEQPNYPIYRNSMETFTSDSKNYYSTGITGTAGGSTTYGVGGSMARFGLFKDCLYVVDQSTLKSFKLVSESDIKQLGTSYLSWNAETIFITDDHLFIGTQNGLIVQSLEVPERPSFVGSFSHMTACDPVVVKGNLAFVTLKGGTACRGGTLNQLDVIKMSEKYSNFTLLKSYPMNGPQGLGIDGDLLFLCDGDAGLKIFDASDPYLIDKRQIAKFPNINAYDVIPMNNYLFMVGEKGFLLFDYSNIQNIKQIGIIPVVKIKS